MYKFCMGDKIDWHLECKDSLLAKEIGPGPFIARGVTNERPCGNGHCQSLSLQKRNDGKLFVWVPSQKEWIEDGQPYREISPSFSNLSFVAVMRCGYCDKAKKNISAFEAPNGERVPICRNCCRDIFGWTFKQLAEYNKRYSNLKSK